MSLNDLLWWFVTVLSYLIMMALIEKLQDRCKLDTGGVYSLETVDETQQIILELKIGILLHNKTEKMKWPTLDSFSPFGPL